TAEHAPAPRRAGTSPCAPSGTGSAAGRTPVAARGSNLSWWDISSQGNPVRTATKDQGSVIAGIGLSADGRTAVTLSGEPGAYTAHVWTITSSRGVAGQAIPPPSRVNGVAVDGRSLAVADADSASVALWHLTGP